MSESEPYIIAAVRTPIGLGRASGALHVLHPVDLLATTLKEVVARAGVKPEDVEDVVAGCVTPIGDQGNNVGRLAALKAGFPVSVPGLQINRFCGSGQQAIHMAAQEIASGDMDIVIACGVEMMSRVPMGSDWEIAPEFAASFPYVLQQQGTAAELIAARWGLTRRALDEYSAESHRKAAAATAAGWYRKEILPIAAGKNGQPLLSTDEGIRPNPDLTKMLALPPAFHPDGVVTAGNSSQISDAASAVLLASGRKADELGLRKRARFASRIVVGNDPELMLTGPIPATRFALARTGLTIDEMDAIEINEAFASVVLAWVHEIEPPMERVNIQGGAIAHGHPLGATGAVLMPKLLPLLERTGGRYGLQTMCIGLGMATATIIERVEDSRA